MDLNRFLTGLQGKNIHLIGVTGSEGSSIFNLLVKNRLHSFITVHDFIDKNNIERNFRLFHKGLAGDDKTKLWQNFSRSLEKVKFRHKADYLEGINASDVIFVPQSWRLYRENAPLLHLWGKTPFYSLSRIYLDFAPAKIIAVTGTVGKGSVADLIFQILRKNGRTVYFAGNESWRLQLAENLAEMKKEDFLVLEISHRQLQDGFNKAPSLTVITNIYPNHLNEVSLKEYQRLKLLLAVSQAENDTTVLNYDDKNLREAAGSLKSNVFYYSSKTLQMNMKNVQMIYKDLMSIKSDQYSENMLAASTVASLLKIPGKKILISLKESSRLPARLELIDEIKGIKIYDDIKSTTPWATIRALEFLPGKIILIFGGTSKKIDYRPFLESVRKRDVKLIIIKSEMTKILSEKLDNILKWEVSGLNQAVKKAFEITKSGETILISPAAAGFYSQFIRGKKSLRKIIKEYRS